MTVFQPIARVSDRVLATLIAGLEIEFGRGAGEGLAQHFLGAEDADFRWETRVEERWLGAYESDDDDDFWLDRVAICGLLDAKWFTAVMIIDGDGNAQGMLGCREFGSRKAAYQAMVVAH